MLLAHTQGPCPTCGADRAKDISFNLTQEHIFEILQRCGRRGCLAGFLKSETMARNLPGQIETMRKVLATVGINILAEGSGESLRYRMGRAGK